MTTARLRHCGTHLGQHASELRLHCLARIESYEQRVLRGGALAAGDFLVVGALALRFVEGGTKLVHLRCSRWARS